jgi:FkbM family methyltransferase
MTASLATIRQRWPYWQRPYLYLSRQRRRAIRLFKHFPDFRYQTILDIGAYRGGFTDMALALLQPDRVVLVEADPQAVQILTQKYAHNARCRIVHAAIIDQSRPVQLRINTHRDASSVLPINAISAELFGKELQEVERVEVPGLSLDALFQQERLEQVDLLKVDIQGAEKLLIAGGRLALSHTRAVYIEVGFAEFYQSSGCFTELHQLLNAHVFKLRSFHECRLGQDGCLAYANALYLRV